MQKNHPSQAVSSSVAVLEPNFGPAAFQENHSLYAYIYETEVL